MPGRSYLTEEQLADTALCSDTEIEKVICAANARAKKEGDKMKDGELRLIWLEGVSRPIPCSELNIQVKIARKVHENQRQKKNLDGLYEVLVPGSTVGKRSPTTSVIKEPNRPEEGVRNSDIAYCEIRNKGGTRYRWGAIYRTQAEENFTKTIEQKIIKHRRDLVQNHL